MGKEENKSCCIPDCDYDGSGPKCGHLRSLAPGEVYFLSKPKPINGPFFVAEQTQKPFYPCPRDKCPEELTKGNNLMSELTYTDKAFAAAQELQLLNQKVTILGTEDSDQEFIFRGFAPGQYGVFQAVVAFSTEPFKCVLVGISRVKELKDALSPVKPK